MKTILAQRGRDTSSARSIRRESTSPRPDHSHKRIFRYLVLNIISIALLTPPSSIIIVSYKCDLHQGEVEKWRDASRIVMCYTWRCYFVFSIFCRRGRIQNTRAARVHRLSFARIARNYRGKRSRNIVERFWTVRCMFHTLTVFFAKRHFWKIEIDALNARSRER